MPLNQNDFNNLLQQFFDKYKIRMYSNFNLIF